MKDDRNISRKILILPILCLLLLSLISLRPELLDFSGEKPSSELTQVETRTETEIRLDYVDSQGRLTVASDKHYATIVKTLDENGNNVVERYFDADGVQVVHPSGYAQIDRTYNMEGLVEQEMYYDLEGNPAPKAAGNCGIFLLYDEKGQNIVVYYLGPDGMPAPLKNGYTIKLKTYNEDGKQSGESYYDGEGNPVRCTTGEAGYINRFDEKGRVSQTEYVDEDGNPVMTTRGYAIKKRTYSENGVLETEMYCDTEGNPVTLRAGYSGIRYRDGKKIYLDRNGKWFLYLSRFLHESHWFVAAIGILLCILSAKGGRKFNIFLLALYLVFIAYMTLMYREHGSGRLQLELFWSYRQFLSAPLLRIEILNNIWLFVPLGTILYRLCPRWYVAFVPVLVSAAVELSQYVFSLGLCELDDIFSNSLGGLIGILLCRVLMREESGGGEPSGERSGSGGKAKE